MAKKRKIKRIIVPPGMILSEKFMKPHGVSQNRLARDLDIPPARIHDIIHGRRGISADTAFRLGVYFKTPPEFWLHLQAAYDLKMVVGKNGARLLSRIRALEMKKGGV